jgi:putative ABC transport system permease protein
MILFHRLKSLARWLFRRRELEADLHRELETFMEMSAADRTRDGETPEQARRHARMELGGVEQTKERVRAGRWGVQLDRLLQDLRYAGRSLAHQPGFTAVVVLTLALGIGFNTAIYTVVDATLLRPLPFKDPEQLMKVSLTRPERNMPPVDFPIWSYPKYQTFRENQEVFQETALYRAITLNLTGDEQPERVRAEEVSTGYFSMLGIDARPGRTFLPEEDAIPEGNLVALISHGLWQRRFGADSGVVGKTITLDRRSYTVLGVLPTGFQALSGPADIWVPVNRVPAESLDEPWAHAWEFAARLKPGVSVEQAQSATAVVGRIVDEAHKSPFGDAGAWGARAEALNAIRVDETIRAALLVLFGAVTCVLLIACVNVANLLLARATTRAREMAIRAAIGAGRARVMRQLLTESLLLAMLGGAASVVVAYAGVYALSAINPAAADLGFGSGTSLLPDRRLSGLTLLGLSSFRIDSSALLFTLVTSLLTGILFGLAPAWQALRADLTQALRKSDDRPSRFALQGRSFLVVVEMALAFVLLAGAGLAIKSFSRLTATPVGIDAGNVLTARLSVPEAGNPDAATLFLTQLEERIARQPGVVSAAVATCHALAGGCNFNGVLFPDRPAAPRGTEPLVGVVRVSPSYFETMKIPVLRGRGFSSADRADAPKVVLINETAARRHFPGQDPIGKSIGLTIRGFNEGAEIVGVVGDVRHGRVEQPTQPDVYLALLQSPQPGVYLFARTAGNPLALVPAVREQVAALDRNLPVYDIRTMRDRFGSAAARARFSTLLLATFAVMAITLAAIGIYGVMSYTVRQRTREIGIRLALGARSGDVVRQVLLRTAALALAGTIAGLAGAFAATRFLTRFLATLYEVRPSDPPTYALIALLVLAVALCAGFLPARRASAVDPAITLRAE